MAGRPRKVSDDEIFGAVADTISAIGPDRLTVAAVAKRVGITAPAIRHRFGSRLDLIRAFASRAADTATETFDAEASTSSDPLRALVAGLAATGSFSDRDEMKNHLALLHLDLFDPQLSTSAARHSRNLLAAIRAHIATAVTRGHIVPSCDIDELADTVLTAYNGALLTWAVDGTGTSRDWLAQRVDRVLRPHRTK